MFCELLLNHIGVEVDNTLFAENSLYFRNALVRASYSSIKDGVSEDKVPLHMFFENLLEGQSHVLRNRDLYCQELYDIEELDNPFPRDRKPSFDSRSKAARNASIDAETKQAQPANKSEPEL